MGKPCDNRSVGVSIERGGLRVMIERRNYPQAYAFIAGHCDGDTFPIAALKETGEEGGLIVASHDIQLLVSERLDNPCKRPGFFHDWEVYKVLEFQGVLKAGSDAKKAFWTTEDDLQRFARRTEYFMWKYSVGYREVGRLTEAIFGKDPSGAQTDPEWKAEMGLEPVWYYLLRRCEIVTWPAPMVELPEGT